MLAGTKSRTTSFLGKVPDENVYRGLEHYRDGVTYPGLLIVRFDGSLFFANAPDFAEEIREGIKLFEPRIVLVDGESISDIDAIAIATFRDLHAELQRLDIDLRFASMKSHVMEIVERTSAVENIGVERFYVSIQAGVDAHLAEQKPSLDET